MHDGSGNKPAANLNDGIEIVELSADDAERRLDELSEVLVDAVDSGASVSFLRPLAIDDARAFWRKVVHSVREGGAVLLGAMIDNRLVGTVQLRLDTPPNQQHRIEVVKLLVHQSHRGQGIGRRLMQQLERSALARSRYLFVLDTLSESPASRLYESLGYKCAGVVPDYAKLSDGSMGATAVYYKLVK